MAKIKTNRINISEFVGKKVIKYTDGEPQVIESKINGEVEFYELTKGKFYEIKDVLGDTVEEIDTASFALKIVPIISNLSVDIDIKDFGDLLEFPTKSFTPIVNMIFETISNFIQLTKDNSELENRLQEKVKEWGIEVPKSKVKVKTKEEQIQDSFGLMAEAIDVVEIQELYKKIDELKAS